MHPLLFTAAWITQEPNGIAERVEKETDMSRRSNSAQTPLTRSASGSRTIDSGIAYRPNAEQRELLVRAATLSGKTLTEFVRIAIEEKIRFVLVDDARIVLNARSGETLIAALTRPPRPNARLVALSKRYAGEVASRE